MSIQQLTHDACIDIESTDDTDDSPLAANASALVSWLDEQPNFMEIEVESRSWRRGRNNRTKTMSKQILVHPDYEVSTRACYGSQAEVAAAWEDMQFPAHNFGRVNSTEGAHLYTWSSTSGARRNMWWGNNNRQSESTINFEAVQHPHGHGVLQHYSTIAAVRTKSGLVLVNEQDFANGFAVMTRPDEWDHELPLSGIEDTLDGHPETVYDIVGVSRDQTLIDYVTKLDPIGGHQVVTGVRESRQNDRQVTRVELSTGAAVVLLWDSTANNPDERKCGFYLTPEEAEVYYGTSGALDSLQPIDVHQAREQGMEIVPSDEFAGGPGKGFRNDELLGECVIRQGEWYLIPMPEDWMPDAPVYKALRSWNIDRTSNWEYGHITDRIPHEESLTDFDAVIDELEPTCPLCDTPGVEIDKRLPVAAYSCDHLVCYDDETYEEMVEDAILGWIESSWKDTYREALDTLDSHRPRDIAVTDEGTFVRGTFRHIRNEHKMLNVEERWHLVVENTRDVNVFDLGTETAGGTARWE